MSNNLERFDKGLLALIVYLDDPLLDAGRQPHQRHKAIAEQAYKRLKADNVWFSGLMDIRADLLKEHLKEES